MKLSIFIVVIAAILLAQTPPPNNIAVGYLVQPSSFASLPDKPAFMPLILVSVRPAPGVTRVVFKLAGTNVTPSEYQMPIENLTEQIGRAHV